MVNVKPYDWGDTPEEIRELMNPSGDLQNVLVRGWLNESSHKEGWLMGVRPDSEQRKWWYCVIDNNGSVFWCIRAEFISYNDYYNNCVDKFCIMGDSEVYMNSVRKKPDSLIRLVRYDLTKDYPFLGANGIWYSYCELWEG